ncbi:MAG: hypothetical protein SFU85_07055, partial [Candidatus Methylacidiphilales bacterium]|nr:hypothetical protein [Candidatus Methylacidiphilales bacterium]
MLAVKRVQKGKRLAQKEGVVAGAKRGLNSGENRATKGSMKTPLNDVPSTTLKPIIRHVGLDVH